LIEPEAPLYEVDAKGKLSVPLKVTRRDAFADAVKLTALGLVDATPPTADVAAKAAASKFEVDVTKLKLTPGDYAVVLQGTAKFKPKSDDPKAKPKEAVAVIHSKPFTLRVKPEVKVEAKPVAKPEAKPAAKPAPEAKPASKPAPAPAPAAKPMPAPAAKPEFKPAAKPEAKPTAKPEAKK
jgi:hypothetical protein